MAVVRRSLIWAVCGLLAAGPSLAQDADDWDFGEDRGRDLAIAAVTYPTFGVAVRCMDDSLSVMVSGVPAGSGERTFGFRMGDGPEFRTLWVSGRDSTTAFAVWPRSVAADLSQGGRLVLGVPVGDEIRRVAVDLPGSRSSISRVFQACGRELHPPVSEAAPSDTNLAGLTWARELDVTFPSRARYEGGLAAVTCRVASNGNLRGCVVESEFPEGSGFGRAATLAAHRNGEVRATDGSTAAIEGRRVSFITRYWTDDAWFQPPPSRLPGRDEVYNPPPPEVRQD